MYLKQRFFPLEPIGVDVSARAYRCRCFRQVESLRATRAETSGGQTNQRFKCIVYKTKRCLIYMN